jgi:hypothetical protein
MRDQDFIQMQEANARRAALILSQFEFLNTRQLAYEQITSTRWGVFLMWWNPEVFKNLVDNRQRELLAACKKERQRAEQAIIRPMNVAGNGNG